MTSDPVADFIIRLQNAARARRAAVSAPYSELKFHIAEALRQAGYLKTVSRRGKKAKKYLEVELAYDAQRQPKLSVVRRISKPSRRVYHRWPQIRAVRQGRGLAVYTTPRGILTDREARAQKTGGEILFHIW